MAVELVASEGHEPARLGTTRGAPPPAAQDGDGHGDAADRQEIAAAVARKIRLLRRARSAIERAKSSSRAVSVPG